MRARFYPKGFGHPFASSHPYKEGVGGSNPSPPTQTQSQKTGSPNAKGSAHGSPNERAPNGRKRYLVRPSQVVSKNDRDRHYIGAADLMRLHGVHPSECIVIKQNEDWPRGYGPLDTEAQREAAGLTLLTPDFKGSYGQRGGRA